MAIIGSNLITEWQQKNGLFYSNKIYSNFNQVGLSDDTQIILSIDKSNDLFLNELTIDYLVFNGKNQAGKYWEFNLYEVDDNYSFSLLATLDSLPRNYDSISQTLNLQTILALNNTLYYVLEARKVGNSGLLSLSGKLTYQHIKS